MIGGVSRGVSDLKVIISKYSGMWEEGNGVLMVGLSSKNVVIGDI